MNIFYPWRIRICLLCKAFVTSSDLVSAGLWVLIHSEFTIRIPK